MEDKNLDRVLILIVVFLNARLSHFSIRVHYEIISKLVALNLLEAVQ